MFPASHPGDRCLPHLKSPSPTYQSSGSEYSLWARLWCVPAQISLAHCHESRAIWGRETWQRAIAHQFDEARSTYSLGHPAALDVTSLIRPDDARSQDLLMLVQQTGEQSRAARFL